MPGIIDFKLYMPANMWYEEETIRVSVSNDDITTLISLDDMLLISETSIRDPVFQVGIGLPVYSAHLLTDSDAISS